MDLVSRLVRPASFALALVAAASPALSQKLTPTPQPRASEYEQTVKLTRIKGRNDTLYPEVILANLDAGNLVAGWTIWAFESQFFVETRVGFLWQPGTTMDVFEIPGPLYWNDNWHRSTEIADNGTVVGTNIFTATLVHLPYQYTISSGFEHLELPQPGNWYGTADAVSADGNVITGTIQEGLGADLIAVQWVGGQLETLGTPADVSRGNDVSADGTVVVGARGPTFTTMQATRWVGGVEMPLDLVPGAVASEAHFVSTNGMIILGRAAVGGRDLLARWLVDGSAETFAPPMGLSLNDLNAINPSGSAAVGSTTDQVLFNEDWDPFLWRANTGFTMIGERADPGVYQYSQANDLSDDGNVVIGRLQAKVVFQGKPPTIGFRWSPETGTQDLDLLVAGAGKRAEGIYDAVTISGDGKRILATGTRVLSLKDTTSMIVEFLNGPALMN